MKNMLLLLLAIAAAACQNNNAEAAARDLCRCLTPMAEIYSEIKSAPSRSEDDLEKMETLMEKLKTTADESDDCSEKVAERYGEAFMEKEETAIKEKMTAFCPQVMEMLQSPENMYE